MGIKRIGTVCAAAMLVLILCLSGCGKDSAAQKIYETDEPAAEVATSQQKGYGTFEETLVQDSYGFVLQKNSPLTERFSEVISEFAQDGTLAALQEKWLSGDEDKMHIDWSAYHNENRGGGVIKYAYEAPTYPMSYSDSYMDAETVIVITL